jgi:hypothetical protein
VLWLVTPFRYFAAYPNPSQDARTREYSEDYNRTSRGAPTGTADTSIPDEYEISHANRVCLVCVADAGTVVGHHAVDPLSERSMSTVLVMALHNIVIRRSVRAVRQRADDHFPRRFRGTICIVEARVWRVANCEGLGLPSFQ